jgi:hypothetical protein
MDETHTAIGIDRRMAKLKSQLEAQQLSETGSGGMMSLPFPSGSALIL